MEFSRQECWSGLPVPSLGILPTRDRTQVSCIAGGFFTTEPPGKLSAGGFSLIKEQGLFGVLSQAGKTEFSPFELMPLPALGISILNEVEISRILHGRKTPAGLVWSNEMQKSFATTLEVTGVEDEGHKSLEMRECPGGRQFSKSVPPSCGLLRVTGIFRNRLELHFWGGGVSDLVFPWVFFSPLQDVIESVQPWTGLASSTELCCDLGSCI